MRDSPLLAPILRCLADDPLPDCWLVAGAVAQILWNRHFGLPHDHGIRDVDVVYFDPDDLSAAGEQRQATRVAELLADLPVAIDVKNEARVHLWYARRFGLPIPPYPSMAAAIATFPTTATAIGVRLRRGCFEIEAPFGLDDLLAGIVRANPVLAGEAVYRAKTDRWAAKWPGLVVVPWRDVTGAAPAGSAPATPPSQARPGGRSANSPK